MSMEQTLEPMLRFREFEDNWNQTKISTLIEDSSILSHLDGNHGELYPRSEEFSATGVPYISANDFVLGNINFDSCKRLPTHRAEKFKKGIAKDGDVLFAHNATVGPVTLLKTNLPYVILSTTATYYRCSEKKLHNHFLKFSLTADYFVRQYTRVMSQSTRNQVPITMQRKFILQLPTLLEQEKIAAFLSSMDSRIEQLQRKKSLLLDYKKGVMQRLFSQQLRFKDQNGNNYPDWQEKKLGEISEVVNGLTYSPADVEETGTLVLRSSNIQGAKLAFHDNVFVSCSVSEDKKSQVGDILICVRNGSRRLIGKNALITSTLENTTHGAFMTVLRGESNSYVYQWLQTDAYQKNVHINLGATINSINGSDLKKFKIPFPSKPEQTKIANYLSNLDTKIDQTTQQISQTQTFKKGLLQQMFV